MPRPNRKMVIKKKSKKRSRLQMPYELSKGLPEKAIRHRVTFSELRAYEKMMRSWESVRKELSAIPRIIGYQLIAPGGLAHVLSGDLRPALSGVLVEFYRENMQTVFSEAEAGGLDVAEQRIEFGHLINHVQRRLEGKD
jgi:hypothetical protein